MQAIFGTTLKSLANITVADVDTQTINEHELETSSNEKSFFTPTLSDESQSIQHLAKTIPGCFDLSETEFFSLVCINCKNLLQKYGWQGNISSPKEPIRITKLNNTYGDDWRWLHCVSGLTGANRKAFGLIALQLRMT